MISAKLKQLMQVKSDIKTALLAKDLIVESTPFSEYPVACSKLQKVPDPVTLTVKFNPKSYTTSGTSRLYVANSTKYKGCLKINGTDYYDKILGSQFMGNGKYYSISYSLKIPYGSDVTVQAILLFASSRSSNASVRYHFTPNISSVSQVEERSLSQVISDSTITFTATGTQVYF